MRREKIQFNNVSDDDIRAELTEMALEAHANNSIRVPISLPHLDGEDWEELQQLASQFNVEAYDYLNAALRQVLKKARYRSEFLLLNERVTRIFQAHDIAVSDIAPLLPDGLTVSDLVSPHQLLNTIRRPHIEHIAELFGVEPRWLQGQDDCPYKMKKICSDIDLEQAAERLAACCLVPNGYEPRVLFIAPTDAFNRGSGYQDDAAEIARDVPVGIVVETRYAVNGVVLKRYETWGYITWAHAPSRLFIKALALFCDRANLTYMGYRLPTKLVVALLQGHHLLPTLLAEPRGDAPEKPAACWSPWRWLEAYHTDPEQPDTYAVYNQPYIKRYAEAIRRPDLTQDMDISALNAWVRQEGTQQ